ncbi:MAG: ATP synthase F1 subunit delta [Gemmatimonadales bacterium]|nr:ATP synthase F1 subunit delta [Gemmatimonadales bacterium]
MAGSIVAQNYAEALFELASRSGQLERYGALIDAVARAFASAPELQTVLVSPRVAKSLKRDLVGRAIAAAGAPVEFVRYLQAVVTRGRQAELAGIARQYGELVDQQFNRVRASVTMARTPDAALVQSITETLGKVLGKSVVVSVGLDPEVLGGAVVKVGDRVYDGSVRRKLTRLKRELLGQ